jgi:hypothetical protein
VDSLHCIPNMVSPWRQNVPTSMPFKSKNDVDSRRQKSWASQDGASSHTLSLSKLNAKLREVN